MNERFDYLKKLKDATMTPFKKVLEFHKAFGLDIATDTGKFDKYSPLQQLRAKLDQEEWNELTTAFNNEDKANLIKEIIDLQYVLLGHLVVMGIDGDEAFDMVHRSNMSKLDDDGKPIFREDGKVLKSHNYKPVNEQELLECKL